MNELFSDIWDLPERNDDDPYAAYKEKGEPYGEEPVCMKLARRP